MPSGSSTGLPYSSLLEKVPGGHVGKSSGVVDSSVIHLCVGSSGVVVVGAAVVVVAAVVLRCGRSKPSTGLPPTMRSFSLGLTTGRLSRPWPKRAIPSWFTSGLPMRSGNYQQNTGIIGQFASSEVFYASESQ